MGLTGLVVSGVGDRFGRSVGSFLLVGKAFDAGALGWRRLHRPRGGGSEVGLGLVLPGQVGAGRVCRRVIASVNMLIQGASRDSMSQVFRDFRASFPAIHSNRSRSLLGSQRRPSVLVNASSCIA